MEFLFIGIYHFFKERRLWLFGSLFFFLLLFAFWTSKLKFEEDITSILPKSEQVEKLNEVFENAKFMDKLVVMVSLKDTSIADPDALVALADSFAEDVDSILKPHIKELRLRIDEEASANMLQLVQDHLPVYLSSADYATMDSLIQPAVIRTNLEQHLQTLTSPAGFALKQIIARDPVGISLLALKKLQSLQYDDGFELIDNIIFTSDQKTLLFFITPQHPPNQTKENEVLLSNLDSLIQRYAQINPHTGVSYFGATAVAAGNAKQLEKDTGLTQAITVVCILVFLAFYFKRWLVPLIIMLPVLFGGLFALAMVYLVKGSISVIAVGTGSVIFGIAINYSLHVFNHFRHCGNMQTVIKDLAFPLTLGGVTTIGGFFCLLFASSAMLNDLGLFAGFSLIGASLSSLIYLPHLVKTREDTATGYTPSWIDKIASFRLEYNKVFIGAIVVLTIVLGYYSGGVAFEDNLNNMNYMSDELKQAEHRLQQINKAAQQSVYFVVQGDSRDEALRKAEWLSDELEQQKQQHKLLAISGVSTLMLSDSLQKLRLDRWNNYWTEEKKQQAVSFVNTYAAQLGYTKDAFYRFEQLLTMKYEVTSEHDIAELQKNFLDDYVYEKEGKTAIVTLVKATPDQKDQLYQQYEDRREVTILDRQYLTGKFVELINADFSKIALLTGALVFIILLITYGRVELALMAFLPMFISWLWILGLMALLDIKFNIINIIVSTLIFGLGDDFSIFIMDGLQQEYKNGRKNLSSFKSSIILSAITAVTGLGVLLLAEHPALRSIAAISVIGILCVVFISQVCIPLFFATFITNRTRKGLYPWTAFSLIKAVFANLVFILGSIGLALVGIFLIKLRLFGKKRGEKWFHITIAGFSRILIYVMGNVKKKIINPLHEDFSRPAIIICNHQSGLDNFVMMMLHPKLLLFTNDRVRNAPVSGWVVRMAGYFSASDIENNWPLVQQRVAEGYSIVLFPEGTRSPDGQLKRFHKGAFYLAEQLNIDILPIVIHGTGATMQKRDWQINNKQITVQFLPRIAPTDNHFGDNYTSRAKQVGRYFREQYEGLRSEIEDVHWFKEKLIYNYIYKGPVLEWYTRIKAALEKFYQPIHALLPVKGKILDIGCGYGIMSNMLHFTAPDREITAIDYDEEKITLAQHCFSKKPTLQFAYANALQYPFQQYNSIIIADMLHYLPHEQQTELLQKCLAHLEPGGTLIVRDGDKDMQEKHKGTALTEWFSTKLLGFNKITDRGLHFLSGKTIEQLALANNMQWQRIDETKYTSNVIYIIKNTGTDETV